MPCLEITTMIGCPLRCTYCPQDKLKASYGSGAKYLSLDNFQRVLAKVPEFVRIDFSGMSEPWANRDATAMLRYTLERGFSVAVYTTLHGMDDYSDVIDLLLRHSRQVEAVVIHLPDPNGNMRGHRPSETYNGALAQFVILGESGRMPWVKTMMMNAPWIGNTRAGALSIDDIGSQPVEELVDHGTPLSCSFTPFYDHNVLLPNGDVVLCCMDYSVKHTIGNLLTDDYYSLFVSEGMNRLRRENMQFGHSDKSICRKCSRATSYDTAPGKRQFFEVTTVE